MGKIVRNPEAFAKKAYDLIIIGGGIYGVMLSFEAAKRGLRCLLLEREDFGGATSFNSLRILHGGFRYLQTVNLHRFFESVNERRWFLRHLPNLANPLGCLMPLYGKGVRKPSFLRIATFVNDVLSCTRNQGVCENKRLPSARVISAEETFQLAPGIDRHGLKGGVIWYDACMQDSQRIVMEMLRWACGSGASVLNYVEAVGLLRQGKKVKGVEARDLENGKGYEFHSNIVVNAAGPWCREIARLFDRDVDGLFRSSLAWNVLLRKGAFSPYALAVAPKKADARTYFMVPRKGKLLVGTGHAAWDGNIECPAPSSEMLQAFLDDLNLAVPGFDASLKDILHVFSGLLPVTSEGTTNLAEREFFLRHSAHDGPEGLYSVSGVKFTTARRVADKTLNQILGFRSNHNSLEFFSEGAPSVISGVGEDNVSVDRKLIALLKSLIEDEAVVHLDDLVFRRTPLWETPSVIRKLAPILCSFFPWDPTRRDAELVRLFQKMDEGSIDG